MSSSSPQPVVTSQQKDPWAGAVPSLNQVMGSAAGLYNSQTGYAPYTGQTQAPLIDQMNAGLGAGTSLAQGYLGGNPTLSAAEGLGQGVVGSAGITPGIAQALNSSTGLGQNLTQYAAMYNKAAGNENPYLQASLDAQNRRIGDQVNSAMSGAGRYASGQHTDVLGRALAEASDPVLAQDYARRQQEQFQALGGLGATNQAMAGLYNQGLNNAGQWAQAAPGFQAAQFAGADKMLGYGDYMQNRSQAELNDQMKLYNAQQAWPWEQLSRYSAIVNQAGGLGGSTVTGSTPYQAPLFNRVAGGALAGAGLGSAFPGVGTGIGAGIGALGGFPIERKLVIYFYRKIQDNV